MGLAVAPLFGVMKPLSFCVERSAKGRSEGVPHRRR